VTGRRPVFRSLRPSGTASIYTVPRSSWCAGILATAAFCLAAVRIDHGLVNSGLPPGPGLTLDESFNLEQGVYLVESLRRHGPLIVSPGAVREVFRSARYLPDHPPLGRLLLGVAHEWTGWMFPGANSSPFNVPAARLGACFALAALVYCMSEWTGRKWGVLTAAAVSGFLLLIPQFVGHARLATLEMATCLAWFAALLPFLVWWIDDEPPETFRALISGVPFGLLLLTKMQGVLLPPLIIAWAVWRFRHRAIRPLGIWCLAGGGVFLAAWPWLWLDPVTHTLQYLGRASGRPELFVWYFGERFTDRQVPWHFPFVMTLITVPLSVVAGLAWRLFAGIQDRAEQLLLASVFWPLIVFALPGTPVYDGTRLFLCIMPALAILAARGFCLVVMRLLAARRDPVGAPCSRWIPVAVLLTLAALARAVTSAAVLDPCAISDYSDIIGGARGASRLGMEASYWGDGLNGEFWTLVPENSTVMVAPVLHQFQLGDIETLVPVVRERRIRLVPFRYDSSRQRGLLLLMYRLADLRPSLREIPPGAELLMELRHDGVVLARLIDTTHADWTITPEDSWE